MWFGHYRLQSMSRTKSLLLYPGKVESVGSRIIRHLAPILPTDEHTLHHNRYGAQLKMSPSPLVPTAGVETELTVSNTTKAPGVK